MKLRTIYTCLLQGDLLVKSICRQCMSWIAECQKRWETGWWKAWCCIVVGKGGGGQGICIWSPIFPWQQQTKIIPYSGDCRVFASIELCAEIFALAVIGRFLISFLFLNNTSNGAALPWGYNYISHWNVLQWPVKLLCFFQ